MEIITKSAQETQELGKKIGHFLIEKGREEHASVLALTGALGSGKTTFVKGLSKALGIKSRVLSPTFVLSREYPLSNDPFKTFIHIDLYRIENPTGIEGLGLSEIFRNPYYLIAIEWPQRMRDLLPNDRMEIHFEHLDEFERKIFINSKIKYQKSKLIISQISNVKTQNHKLKIKSDY